LAFATGLRAPQIHSKMPVFASLWGVSLCGNWTFGEKSSS